LHKSDEPLPDFVERAYAVEIAAAGASDDRRQVLGELVVLSAAPGSIAILRNPHMILTNSI